MKRFLKGFLIFAGVSFASCTTLKPYERVYVNDPEMQIDGGGANFEYYVESIREGSLAGKGDKGSGGCGCN